MDIRGFRHTIAAAILGLGLTWASMAAWANDFTVRRFPNNPIIRPDMLPGEDGKNINGPSLIRAPGWLEHPLGKYYLYFAHHAGKYIRLAYADDLAGPWKIYEPGTLKLQETPCKDFSRVDLQHVASPDVIIDEASHQLRLYFHCPVDKDVDGHQQSYVATSRDGLHFDVQAGPFGRAYYRVVRWNGAWYAIGMPGVFFRSADGIHDWTEGPQLWSDDMRHSAVMLDGDTLSVFYTMVGDKPERILHTTIALSPDWSKWKTTPPTDVVAPEMDYEGGLLPLEASKRFILEAPGRQLRDPAIYREDGKTYLLYSVAGEQGIAIAEISPSPEQRAAK